MTNLFRATLMGALLSVPLAGTALAADAPAMSPDMMATLVCRTAHAGESPTALTVADKGGLVCKPVSDMMKSKPKMDKSMSMQQIDDAWNTWTNNVFAISPYQK